MKKLIITLSLLLSLTACDGQPRDQAQAADKEVNVELFVMSHCPFGIQIEKGILPVLDTIGEDVNFELKFVDYAMHGRKELEEQLYQYCIQKEENDKLKPYLSCFLEDGNSVECLHQSEVDIDKVTSCVEKTNKKYDVIDNFENKKDWHGKYPSFAIYKEDNERYEVAGSPTLVINGEKIKSDRDPASLLAAICDKFENKPESCSSKLSDQKPSAKFGY